MKAIPLFATALSILVMSLGSRPTAVQEQAKSASPALSQAEEVDWVVVCESGLIEVKSPPDAPSGAKAVQVSFSQLKNLSDAIHGRIGRYRATSEREAKEAFVTDITSLGEFEMDVIGEKKDTLFTAHPDISIPSDRRWVIRGGAQYAHLMTKASRGSKPGYIPDAKNRRVAYATEKKLDSEGGGLRYLVLSAPILAFELSEVPKSSEPK